MVLTPLESVTVRKSVVLALPDPVGIEGVMSSMSGGVLLRTRLLGVVDSSMLLVGET